MIGRETVGKRDFNKRGERLLENRTDCFRPVAVCALALPRFVAFSDSLYVLRRGYLKNNPIGRTQFGYPPLSPILRDNHSKSHAAWEQLAVLLGS